MQIAVLILFATREIGLSTGAIGAAYACGGLSSVLASMSARFGISPVNVHGLILSTFGWQAFGLIDGPPWQQLAIASRVIQRVTCANTLDRRRRVCLHRASGTCQIARCQPIAVVAFYPGDQRGMRLMASLHPSFRTRQRAIGGSSSQ
jgi:hypothetical protein